MSKMIYSKFSNDRDPLLSIITEIIETDGKLMVSKRAYTAKAQGHIDSLYRKYKKLSNLFTDSFFRANKCTLVNGSACFEYLSGGTLEEKLDEFLIAEDTAEFRMLVDLFVEEVRRVYKPSPFQMSEDFVKVFGEVNLPLSINASHNINIDMLFSNIIIEDSNWEIIDYEWTFDFLVPINFLIYRTIYYYSFNNKARSILSCDSVLELFGITAQEIEQYKKMNIHFMTDYVLGSTVDIHKLYKFIGQQSISLESIIKTYKKETEKLKFQIYYDYGDGFSEEESDIIEPKWLSEGSYRLEVGVPENIKSLRLDPGYSPCLLVVADFQQSAQSYNYDVEFEGNSVTEDKKLLIYTTDDPYIIVSNLRTDAEKLVLKFDYNTCDEEISRAASKYYRIRKQKDEKFKREFDILMSENAINEKIIEENRKVIEEKDRVYASLISSSSWRLTAPLRALSEALRKISFFRKAGRLVKVFIRHGLKEIKLRIAVDKVLNSLDAGYENGVYQNWIEVNENEKVDVTKLEWKPLISIIVPVYNARNRHLMECIESVINQTYENWELILVDDKSTKSSMKRIIKKYSQHEKITGIFRSENGHISKATNDGINVSKGEYISFLDCDDTLYSNALYHVVSKINENTNYDYIYSDEDKLSADGKRRFDPYFKPEWSPDLLMSCNYVNHFSVYRNKIVKELGGLRTQFDGTQDYDLILRATEVIDWRNIGHIPKVLYNWRVSKNSTALNIENKGYVFDAMKRAKEEALQRRGLTGKVVFDRATSQYIVEYCQADNPLVSVVILSRDNVDMLIKCINSLRENTLYENIEIIVVDNGSSEKNKSELSEFMKENNINYLYEIMEFNFSKMCNMGAAVANGEFVLFLNDDVEIVQNNWLSILLGQAGLAHTGAVGAKLLYPNSDLIQHSGIIIINQGPSHALLKKSDSMIMCNGRNRFNYNYLAVTGACLMIAKEKFLSVEGFDESLPIGYNDVSLCLKLMEKGYYNVVRNDVICYHHESVSRGDDSQCQEKLKRLLNEKSSLYLKFPGYRDYDPYVNSNFCKDSIYFVIDDVGRPSTTKIIDCDINVLSTLPPFVGATIDSIAINNERIVIVGWCITDTTYDLLYKRQLMIKLKEGKVLIADTRRRVRDDLLERFGKYIKYSGFICEIDKEYLEQFDNEGSICFFGEYRDKKLFERLENVIGNTANISDLS